MREINSGSNENRRYKLLLIDDDAQIRSALIVALGKEYDVVEAAEGEAGLLLAHQERPDMILLDVNMPGKNGIWTCENLRGSEVTRDIPILMLSSRNEIEEKLAAYNVGADDYLEKPFLLPELKAKIQARIRRITEKMAAASLAAKKISNGNLNLYVNRMEVEVDSRKVHLSILETRLLAYFLTNPENVLSRQDILNNVWKSVAVSNRTVDAHIVGLRRKIAGFNHEIMTVYGAGYSLRPKVEKVEKSQRSLSSN